MALGSSPNLLHDEHVSSERQEISLSQLSKTLHLPLEVGIGVCTYVVFVLDASSAWSMSPLLPFSDYLRYTCPLYKHILSPNPFSTSTPAVLITGGRFNFIPTGITRCPLKKKTVMFLFIHRLFLRPVDIRQLRSCHRSLSVYLACIARQCCGRILW